MFIQRLVIQNFRNLQHIELETLPNFNLISGPNGAGKTSVLEAICYLALGRSFRNAGNQYLVQQGQNTFSLFAQIQEQVDSFASQTTIGMSRTRGEDLIIKVNSDPLIRRIDLVDHICVQMIHPQGIELITKEAEGRRSFVDWGVYYSDPEFKNLWIDYRKALKQRNALLLQNSVRFKPRQRRLQDALSLASKKQPQAAYSNQQQSALSFNERMHNPLPNAAKTQLQSQAQLQPQLQAKLQQQACAGYNKANDQQQARLASPSAQLSLSALSDPSSPSAIWSQGMYHQMSSQMHNQMSNQMPTPVSYSMPEHSLNYMPDNMQEYSPSHMLGQNPNNMQHQMPNQMSAAVKRVPFLQESQLGAAVPSISSAQKVESLQYTDSVQPVSTLQHPHHMDMPYELHTLSPVLQAHLRGDRPVNPVNTAQQNFSSLIPSQQSLYIQASHPTYSQVSTQPPVYEQPVMPAEFVNSNMSLDHTQQLAPDNELRHDNMFASVQPAVRNLALENSKSSLDSTADVYVQAVNLEPSQQDALNTRELSPSLSTQALQGHSLSTPELSDYTLSTQSIQDLPASQQASGWNTPIVEHHQVSSEALVDGKRQGTLVAVNAIHRTYSSNSNTSHINTINSSNVSLTSYGELDSTVSTVQPIEPAFMANHPASSTFNSAVSAMAAAIQASNNVAQRGVLVGAVADESSTVGASGETGVTKTAGAPVSDEGSAVTLEASGIVGTSGVSATRELDKDRTSKAIRDKDFLETSERGALGAGAVRSNSSLNSYAQRTWSSAESEFAIWNEAIADLSEQITQKRLNYLADLQIVLQEVIEQFLPNFKLKFELYFGWDKSLDLRSQLAQNLEKERGLGYTLYGCHRADLKIKNHNLAAGATLSRGQLKMLVYAMRLAQGMLLKQQSHRSCIYLIDDLNSELDENSQRRLLNTLIECQHQVFISNIQSDFRNILIPRGRSDIKVFSLDQGRLVGTMG